MDQVRITGRLDVPEGELESAKQEVSKALSLVAERYGGRLCEVVDRNEAWGPPPEEITGQEGSVERAAANKEIRDWDDLPDDL
ncbi:MAG TPA: hypothetical protein VMY37_15220 [Thermoguttaceae bacterium]|nr:hypothetical protein [Thermoguttaceae bacterium]